MQDKEVTYEFHLKSGEVVSHTVAISDASSVVLHDADMALPDWTQLEFHRCPGCRWDKSNRCPVATGLITPASMLDKIYSHETMLITVDTPERRYSKTTSVQEGLSGLFGLIMARSCCPVFDAFRGLAWFHLPFATFEETLFRVISTYLLRRMMHGEVRRTESEMIQDIEAIYNDISVVNQHIIERLIEGAAPQCDTPFNAIALLDALGGMVRLSVEDGLVQIKNSFI